MFVLFSLVGDLRVERGGESIENKMTVTVTITATTIAAMVGWGIIFYPPDGHIAI